MKIAALILIVFLFHGVSWSNPDKTLADVKGIDLYMCYDIFGNEGRRLTMDFSETQRFEQKYKLEIVYEIVGSKIIISVVDKTVKFDKYVYYPKELNRSYGIIYLPDSILSNKKYTLILKTANFEVKSKLLINDDVIELKVPKNKYFSCRINKVYPEPKNLIFGSIVFYGNKDNKVITTFFEKFEKLGLTKKTLPNYRYKYLTVDDSGRPINKFYPNGENVLSFLYEMDTNFREIAKFIDEWYLKYYPSIIFFVYCSNGDQALGYDKDGVHTFFTDE